MGLFDDAAKTAAVVATPGGVGINYAAGNPLGAPTPQSIGAGIAGMKNGIYAPSPRDLTDIAAQTRVAQYAPVANYGTTQIGSDALRSTSQAQQGVLDMLSKQAQGQGPSIAGMQLQHAQEAALAAQQAQLASQRGQYNPGAVRSQMQAAANLNAQIANQAAQARLQEQQNAIGQLGNIRGQEQSAAAQQATLDAQRQAALFNAAEARNLGTAGMQFQVNQMPYQAAIAQNAADANQYAQNRQTNQDIFNGLSSVLGGSASAIKGTNSATTTSDERAKKDIKPMDDKMAEFLDTLHAMQYKYKEPEKHGAGKRIGVMAQDVEKSDAGSEMVHDDEEGTKQIDARNNIGTLLAAMGSIHQRLKKLEK